MIVLAALLAALAVWLVGVNAAADGMGAALGTQQARLATAKLASAINSACVMGTGNTVSVEVSVPGNATVSYGDGLTLAWGNKTFTERVYCGFSDFMLVGRERLDVTNDAGTIIITRTT